MGGRPHRKDREDSLLDHDGLDGDTDSGGGGGSGGGVTALGLVSVGFFWVSGGSYGNEALILSAPPGILLFGITVVGLCYGIPLALITAELGTGWPLAGGMAQWVEVGCGERMGAHNAWWVFSSTVFDAALSVLLAVLVARSFLRILV